MSVSVDLVTASSILGAAVHRWAVQDLKSAGFDGVRPAHDYVVQRLLVEPQTATEVAAALRVSQQAVSKSIAELEAAGYVARTVDPRDKRRQPVALTERGHAMITRTRIARAELLARISDRVGADRLAQTQDVLLTVLDVLGVTQDIERRAVPAIES